MKPFPKQNPENFLSNIIDNNPLPICVIDAQGTLIHINNACCEMLKINKNDVIQKYNIFRDNNIKDQGHMNLVESVFQKGETALFELKYDTSKLEGFSFNEHVFLDLETSIFPVKEEDGTVSHALIQYRNIHCCKSLEEELRLSSESLKKAQSIARIGSWEWDITGKKLHWSQELYPIFGIPQSFELTFNSILSLIHPEDRDYYNLKVKDLLENRNEANFEFRIIRPEGNIRNLYQIIELERNIQGEAVSASGTIQDITDRKQWEQELMESEKCHRNVLETMEMIAIMLNTEGNITFCNDYFLKLTGWERNEILGKNWFETFLPQDIRDTVKHSVFKKLIKTGDIPAHYQNSIITKSGESRLIAWNNTVTYNAGGNIINITSIGEDITEQKQIENSLRFQAELLNTVKQSVIATDPEGNITYVNRAAEELHGWTSDEVMGRDILNVVLPEKSRKSAADKFEQVKSGQQMLDEFLSLRKDGSTFPVEVSCTPLMDSEGNLTGIIGVASDITERKKSQEQIEKSLAEKEMLLREVHHRVKNNMQVITSLFRLQSTKVKNKEDHDVFITCQNRVLSMAAVHERIYKSDDLASIDLKELIVFLAQSLLKIYQIDTQKIKIKYNFKKIRIGMDLAIPLGQIANELLMNTLKHAFPNMQKGEIMITFESFNEDKYQFIFADNGIGLPDTVDLNNIKSLGLRIMNELVNSINGTMSVDRINGTAYTITFNKKIKDNIVWRLQK